jgi:hypothetical protein
VLSENASASTTTSSKRKKKPKEINFYDPFTRVDPKLLEQMYRAAQKEKLKQQPEASW